MPRFFDNAEDDDFEDENDEESALSDDEIAEAILNGEEIEIIDEETGEGFSVNDEDDEEDEDEEDEDEDEDW